MPHTGPSEVGIIYHNNVLTHVGTVALRVVNEVLPIKFVQHLNAGITYKQHDMITQPTNLVVR